MYERLVDDGIAAADSRGSTVDHLTARRLAIWLAARPQALDFAQGLVRSVETGAISPAPKICRASTLPPGMRVADARPVSLDWHHGGNE
jgi:hypothetical protein